MDLYIFYALMVVLLNIAISSSIPVLLQKYSSNEPMFDNIKKVFKNNKELIISNSIILGVTVYIALHMATKLEPEFTKITGISLNDPYEEDMYNDDKYYKATNALLKLSQIQQY